MGIVLFLLRLFQKKRKKKVIKLRRDKLAYCLSCGEALYLELDKGKHFADDWESSCHFCLNKHCKNYGKVVITVYNPDTFIPYAPRVREEDEPLLTKDDPRIEIVN